MKCLYDRASRLVTKPSVISKEKKHLSSVLVSNGYPPSFVQKITKAKTAPKREPVAEFKSTAVLPYVQGVLGPLRRCLEQQGIRTVFKSDTTLRSWCHLRTLSILSFVIFYRFAVLILKLSFNIYLGTLQLVHFTYLISFRFVADRNLEVKSCSMVYMHLTRGVSFIKTNL